MMAHFAEIKDGLVVRVLVVDNEEESRAQDFLAIDLGLGGTWIQTSYHGNFRGCFAGIDYEYDEASDTFIPPEVVDNDPTSNL